MNRKELAFEIIMSCIAFVTLFGGFIFLPGLLGGTGYIIAIILFVLVLMVWGFIGKRFIK